MKFGFIVLAILFNCWIAFAGRENPLFLEYPITHEFTLKSGEKVPMPFQIYDGEAAMFMGTASLSALKPILAANNLLPARVSAEKGLVGLYIIHYTDTVIGSYYETFLSVLVNYQQPTRNDIFKNYLDIVKVFMPELNSDEVEKGNLGFFAWKLWVDSDLAMRTGHEIWGYNKTMAIVDMKTNSMGTTFSLTDEAGSIFSASVKSVLIPLMYSFPMKMDFLSTTPVEIKQTTGRAIIRADASIRSLFESDVINFNPGHKWGKALLDIQFEPSVWIQTQNPSSVIFDPLLN